MLVGNRAGRRPDGRPPCWPRNRPTSRRELAALSRKIFELAGVEFNINSPKQLGEVLFEKLQLPSLKRTGKTRAVSTAVEVLEELALTHELPRLVLEWRGAVEAQGHLHRRAAAAGEPADRPRAHVVQPGGRRDRAAVEQRSEPAEHPDSHRARARDPPRLHRRAGLRADLGRLLADRAARARAPVGRRDADRRVSARRRHPRSDGAQGLRRRQRPRARTSCAGARRSSTTRCSTARRRSRWPRTSASRSRRRRSSSTRISPGFPRVRGVHRPTLDQARATGVVKTMFGRRRLVPEIVSRNGQVRAAAERMTVNMPIQGTAADILKLAMIALDAELGASRTPAVDAGRADDSHRARRAGARGARGGRRRDRGAGARDDERRRHVSPCRSTSTSAVGENWKDAKS